MLMDAIHYLPTEKLTAQNYPEVGRYWEDINKLTSYAEHVSSAIIAYNEEKTDHINVSIVEIREHIMLARSLCTNLTEAKNICYDLLLGIRGIQKSLQELLYAYNRFGTQYIGMITKGGEEE